MEDIKTEIIPIPEQIKAQREIEELLSLKPDDENYGDYFPKIY